MEHGTGEEENKRKTFLEFLPCTRTQPATKYPILKTKWSWNDSLWIQLTLKEWFPHFLAIDCGRLVLRSTCRLLRGSMGTQNTNGEWKVNNRVLCQWTGTSTGSHFYGQYLFFLVTNDLKWEIWGRRHSLILGLNFANLFESLELSKKDLLSSFLVKIFQLLVPLICLY